MRSEVTFTGSLSELEKKAEEWRASNPRLKIIDTGPPIKVGYWDGHSAFEQEHWSITMKYEDPSDRQSGG